MVHLVPIILRNLFIICHLDILYRYYTVYVRLFNHAIPS